MKSEPASPFERRHIGPSSRDIAEMLRAVNASSLDELMSQTLPADIRPKLPLALGAGLSEVETLAKLRNIAAKNQVFTSLIGQGYHGTITPGVIQRNILENPAWYTAYTPYQPEISQGRLEALFFFQTLICDLTGLDMSNASLLDEATAAAEAMALAQRTCKNGSNVFFVDENAHPQTIAVLKTRAEPLGWQIIIGNPLEQLTEAKVFGALLQYPGTRGGLVNPRETIELIHNNGGLAIIAADPLALTLLISPGELGADIAIGSMQRFGVPMGFGGPHAAYMAVKDALKRAIPGRIVGLSIDARGNPAYRLTLQTREQHIRREKATSNICTAQVLLAVMATMYAIYHGPEGLRRIASTVHALACHLAEALRKNGFKVHQTAFFDTVSVDAAGKRADILKRAKQARINFRLFPNEETLGITLDETTTTQTLRNILAVFGIGDQNRDFSTLSVAIPAELARKSPFLTHPTFHKYHSETEMLRYIRRLSDRDLSLDRAMIPLGSCTMKLNATTEMIPVTWPEFGALHPYAPQAQTKGYSELFADLEAMLCAITGYDAVSLQPNSGAQGEYAGLLAIRAYYHAKGDKNRNICLIPSSAHGTNPASAAMAGMTVVVVGCDALGNIDVADLTAKAEKHKAALAAVMITYPSTHGVFEEKIREICEIVHKNGGQVYLDGANLNAQVGLARPGEYGADVSHLNLHKTFCIPHGGGGPGAGPIGVRAHLAPFLPGHIGKSGAKVGPVSAAPHGSSSILPISYAYILLMGAEGLKKASEVAILSANYIATRLDPHFPVLYKNQRGRVAHECILDPRSLKDKCGVTVDDIAKRLIDFGFHAPTMSFPVPGTLMIEPTESESKTEIDRFINAMIAIRTEITAIENGKIALDTSPLRHAPHTIQDLAADDWNRAYSRAQGCYPTGTPQQDKYFASVGRVDNVYGDRNLVCSCPPMDSYSEAAE